MKNILFTVISLSLSSIVLAANPSDLPMLPVEQYTVIGKVTLGDTLYQKVVKSDSNKAAMGSRSINGFNADSTLFAGDMVKKGAISSPMLLNGNFIISAHNSRNIPAIVKDHNLKVDYISKNLALVKTQEGTELVALLKALQADKRVASAVIEKISNKMEPE